MTASPEPHGGGNPPTASVGPTPLNAGDPIWVRYGDAWLRGHIHRRGASHGMSQMWPGVTVTDGLLISLDPGQGFTMPAGRDWDLLIPDASSPEVRPRTGTHTPRQLKAVYG